VAAPQAANPSMEKGRVQEGEGPGQERETGVTGLVLDDGAGWKRVVAK
jgi:hypothetical protein